MSKISIIRFNDDNHAERIWANGEYIGSLSDIEDILKNFMNICNKVSAEEIESTSIWVCDDFEEFEEDDELVDDIWCWFNEVEKMTEEQIKLVQEKNWKELHKVTI